MSLTIAVPAAVPSEDHSSVPLTPSSAAKYSLPLKTVKVAGELPVDPDRMSATIDVPTAVPSEVQSSEPLTPPLVARKYRLPLKTAKWDGELLLDPDRMSATIDVPAAVPLEDHSSLPLTPSFASKKSLPFRTVKEDGSDEDDPGWMSLNNEHKGTADGDGVGVEVLDGVGLGVGVPLLVGVPVGLGVPLLVGLLVGLGVGVDVEEAPAAAGADGVVDGVGVGVGVEEEEAPAAGADGVVDGVLEVVGDGVGVPVRVGEGVGRRRGLTDSTLERSTREYEEAQMSSPAGWITESSTRTEKLAASTGEAVVAPSCPEDAPQLPRLKVALAAIGWDVLSAPLHETRRTRDTGTPAALAREQRMSVMLEADRVALRVSKTTLMMDWGGGKEEAVVVAVSSLSWSPTPRPTPRARTSAATIAARRQHCQNAETGRFSFSFFFSSSLSSACSGLGDDGPLRARALTVRSAFLPLVVIDTATDSEPTGSNSTRPLSWTDAIWGGVGVEIWRCWAAWKGKDEGRVVVG
jgi:hypothetical protein